MLTAVVLTLWAIFCIFDVLGPTLIYASRPLIAGTVAGLIIGDVTLGMAVGATMELAALGVYTYGGATIPDYTDRRDRRHRTGPRGAGQLQPAARLRPGAGRSWPPSC